MSTTGFVLSEASQNIQLNGNSAAECEQVSGGLCHLQACCIKEHRQYKNEGNEEQSLSGNSQEGGGDRSANGLHQHIAHDHPALYPQCQALKTQCTGTELNDCGIITEQ